MNISNINDFLIRDKNHITEAIQVCWALTPDSEDREIGGLLEAIGHCRVQSHVIITRSQSKIIKRDSKIIKVVPIIEWLLS